MIGCPVTVLEDRPQFAEHARQAGATKVICDSFENGLAQIPGDTDTFFIIVTRGHRSDQLCLKLISQKDHAYIGMMGSRTRVAKVKESLMADGVDEDILDSLHAPIGPGNWHDHDHLDLLWLSLPPPNRISNFL